MSSSPLQQESQSFVLFSLTIRFAEVNGLCLQSIAQHPWCQQGPHVDDLSHVMLKCWTCMGPPEMCGVAGCVFVFLVCVSDAV